MNPKAPPLRSPLAAAVSGALLALALALAISEPGRTDDRDLLRFTSAKPYLFLILDTSSSMNMKIGPGAVSLAGGGDNPDSRIYAAKQALYNVFANVDDVAFGFATYNQDHADVRSKHWLYYAAAAGTVSGGTWPLGTYPTPNPSGLTTFADDLNLLNIDSNGDGKVDNTDSDGVADTVHSSIVGDVMTFGPFINADGAGGVDSTPPNWSPPNGGHSGSCSSPWDLSNATDRAALNSFPMLGMPVSSPTDTVVYVKNGGSTYKLTVHLASGTPTLGVDDLNVTLSTQPVSGCVASGTIVTQTLTLTHDPRLSDYLIMDKDPTLVFGGKNDEVTPGFWSWADAIVTASCSNPHPFSGDGWEGNYDSNDTPPAGITLAAGEPTNDDAFCVGASCIEIKPMAHTQYSTFGRALDSGDVLPFDWVTTNRDEMLHRLAPNLGITSPANFGIGPNLVSSSAISGNYEPAFANRPPIIAAGASPVGKTALDFRCWYEGETKGGKCKSATVGEGWVHTACTFDPEFACRRPYLIVISDGDDDCDGENPTADIAAMNSQAGVQTWAINLGEGGKKGNCNNASILHSMTQAGKGECVDVATPEDLYNTILQILGKIREEARTFASAAVPSVQTEAKQALYLTDFTPVNGLSRWPGHLNAFRKPLPLTPEKRPDTSRVCPAFDPTKPDPTECFLWDAGRVIATQSERKIYYGKQSKFGLWAPNRLPFEPPTLTTPHATNAEYDLWRGFGLIAQTQANASLDAATEAALHDQLVAVINITTGPVTRTTGCDPAKDLCTFKLGDIFHSDPLIFGQPNNVTFLRQNLGAEFNTKVGTPQCSATDETTGGGDNPSFDRSYRCFLQRFQFRRQVLAVGSNDGMVHVLNAAEVRPTRLDYDGGTGNELFAYVPRGVMPTVMTNAGSTQQHYAVDGPMNAADVFIDPIDDGDTGTSDGYPNATERRWRSVLVGGFREGGPGYFALDVTQPDALVKDLNGNFVPKDFGSSDPNHLPTCLDVHWTEADCGPVQYGAPLWEFNDSTDNQKFSVLANQPAIAETMDEDGNGLPDLGDSWSQVDFARVKVCEGVDCTVNPDDLKEHFVVFFGGGMDVEHKDFDPRSASAIDPDGAAGPEPSHFELRGNWLYMVDVETGNVLYKRQLCSPYRTNAGNSGNNCVPGGSTPSEVAAVDTDFDGFVDRVYVATTGGYVYRTDLQRVVTVAGVPHVEYPKLVDTTANAIDPSGNPVAVTIKRVEKTDAGGAPIWTPQVVFDANWAVATSGGSPVATTTPRQVYFRPSVIIDQVAGGAYALAFGTGDREDLWNAVSATAQEGRFYMFLDVGDPQGLNSSFNPSCPAVSPYNCPRTEAALQRIETGDISTADDLLKIRTGWFLALPLNERTITDAFSFSGVTFFATYKPLVGRVDPVTGEPIADTPNACANKGYLRDTGSGCGKTGTSTLYLVDTRNANGLLVPDPTNAPDTVARSTSVANFVTNPFTEFTTGNQAAGQGGTGGENADTLTAADKAVMDVIKKLYPSTCRFTNARIDIRTITADTKLQKLASIPICLSGHSWKEF